jgi:hypothetical protein
MDRKDLRIGSPCTLDWRKMTPAEGGRFCGDCKKVVRNLSSMSELEARELLESAGPDLCVRYVYDKHGRIFFREQTIAPSLLVRARRLATIAALPLATAACDLVTSPLGASDDPPNHDELMGGMVYDPRDEPPPAEDGGSPDAQSTDAGDAGSDAQPDG